MKPTEKIIRLAKEQALKSDYRFRIGAVIYDDHGWILGRGYNQPNRTHPKANTPYSTIHAEFDAVLDAQAFRDPGTIRGTNIYVHRLSNSVRGHFLDLLAKPCPYCRVMLRWAEIKGIYYSGNEASTQQTMV